jgi:putative phosphoribosyl transferase
MSPSRPDSYEQLAPRFLLDLRKERNPDLRERLSKPRLERFIGVIYRPATERSSHYSEASLPERFNAYVWLDESCAVTPLAGEVIKGEEDTYPFGL